MLRRPLIAIDQLEKFHRSFAEEKNQDFLRNWFNENSDAQEAIYLASGVLYERFVMWLRGEHVSEADKLELSIYKYFVRMSTRCTPYGLFALASTGRISTETNLAVSTDELLVKHTRLDMECLIAIKEWLIRQQSVRMQLTLLVNSSLYSSAEDFRYIEEVTSHDQRNYFVSSLENNEFLSLIIEKARHGVKIPDLITLLQGHDIESVEAYDFIDELIENRILVTELEPNVTGPGYLDAMIDQITHLEHSQLLTGHLHSLRIMLDEQNDRVQMYKSLREKMDFLGIPAVNKNLVHVDTISVNQKTLLSESIVSTITTQLSHLFTLNRPKSNTDLEDFKIRFLSRYQEQEIPLTTALDHQTGIGYGLQSTLGASYTPMIEELTFPNNQKKQYTEQPEWYQNLLIDKYTLFLKDRLTEIELTNRDLDAVQDLKKNGQANTKTLPFSFYVLGNLLAKSGEAADQGEFLFNFVTCSGPSAANILSRFHEADRALSVHLLNCTNLEEKNSPDVIFAEIVHCPDSGAGNIMTRPVLHRYEIPYMGKSSVEKEFQIPVQDLMISVVNDNIIIRSKRLNKRIIPRLSNAHNFTRGLPVYKFLCALQSQETDLNMQWDWGLFNSQPHLPRVKYKNIILSRESWLLATYHFNSSEPAQINDKLNALGLPPTFVITSGDNELLIDTRISLSLQILMQEISKKGEIRVFEALFSSDNSVLRKEHYRFMNEIVIPLYNTKATPLKGVNPEESSTIIPQRNFSTGTEWLYFKIYCQEKSSDKILWALYPLISQLLEENTVSAFFFVRYQDPEYHLRFRFKGDPGNGFYHQVIDVINEMLAAYVRNGLVYKIQLDTYEREIERYGFEQIEICEKLFFLDSMDFLEAIYRMEDLPDESERFALAVRRIFMILSHSDMELSECVVLMENLKEGFFNEFEGNSILRKQLGTHYRNNKSGIEEQFDIVTIGTDLELQNQLTHLSKSLLNRSRYYKIIGSLIHMSVNRTFNTKQRAYELILYHCIAKHYDSLHARQLKLKR